MSSPTNYAPHDRPQQQDSAHPTAKRSPIAHKEKNHAPRCAKRGFYFVPRTGFEPVLPA